MRIFNAAAFMIVLAITGITIGCNAPDSPNPQVSPFEFLALPDFDPENAGDAHNDLLADLVDVYDSATIANMSDVTELVNYTLDSISIWMYADGKDTAARDSEGVDSLESVYSGVVDLDDFQALISSTSEITDNVSTEEIDFVDSCIDALQAMDLSNETFYGACVALRNEAATMITECESRNFGSDPLDGELARSVLDVAYSSPDFWKDNPGNLPSPDYNIAAVIAYFDVGGYVFGWVKAVVEELIETNDIDRAKEWDRIGEGVKFAAGASFLKYLGFKGPVPGS